MEIEVIFFIFLFFLNMYLHPEGERTAPRRGEVEGDNQGSWKLRIH